MSKTEMPAVEVSSYELAFHVLPTIAEGEVATIFQGLKDMITKKGGEFSAEEAPARFDLAYEVEKYLEGRNRKFSSAYFGWVRFSIDPATIEGITATVEADNNILRHLLTKLTKVEEENPFFFHEALEKDEKVKNVEVEENPKEDIEEEKVAEPVKEEEKSEAKE